MCQTTGKHVDVSTPLYAARKNELFSGRTKKDERTNEHFRFCTPQSNDASRNKGFLSKGSIWISFNLNLAGFDQEDRIDVDQVLFTLNDFL